MRHTGGAATGEGKGRALPSPPSTHTSFRLSSDTKENLLLERNGSFLAPTQILHDSILEHLRSLNAVLFPYHHIKPSRKRAGLFAGLPQPCQEGITKCDPSHSPQAEDTFTALIQLTGMSTTHTRKHIHPPISWVPYTGQQQPARTVTSQDRHTHTPLQQKHSFLESHSQVTISPRVS